MLNRPTSPTPALCPVPPECDCGLHLLHHPREPRAQPQFTFPTLCLADQDPKAQHGPLPQSFSQAGSQRVPHRVLQYHSMMVKSWVAAWDFLRMGPQSRSLEPTFLSGPSLHWEVGKESSSCLILEESSNWKEKRKEKNR